MSGGVGALIMVTAIAVGLFMLFVNRGVQLNTAQFDTMFSQGSTVAGITVESRTSAAAIAPITQPCLQAATDLVTKKVRNFTAVTSNETTAVFGALYESPTAAAEGFARATNTCEGSVQGVRDGARWFTVNVGGFDVVGVQFGNVAVLVKANANSTLQPESIAAAVQQETIAATAR